MGGALAQEMVVVFFADDLAAWLVGLLANEARRRLTGFVLGEPQERSLRTAAKDAIRLTADELEEEPAHLAMVIGQVFNDPTADRPLTSYGTLLEAVQTTITQQLAVLDDAALTGTGHSSAELLGHSADEMAQKLAGHLIQAIIGRGLRGGPLKPLADQLNHDVTHLQVQRVGGILGKLLDQVKVTSGDRSSIGTVSAPGPVGLPPDPPQGVVGRADVVRQIRRLLDVDGRSVDVPPVSVCGTAGVGKTTVAAAVGRDAIADQVFPDGVLWISLGPAPDLRPLLEALGRERCIDLFPEPDLRACTSRLRAEMSSARLLIVIDDVWKAAHAWPFRVGGPVSRTLLTTRDLTVAYEFATESRSYHLDVLTPAHALDLLGRLAPGVVSDQPEAAAQLCERMGFLPLGLTLAGRLLAVERDVPNRTIGLLRDLSEHGEARLAMAQSEGRLGVSGEAASVRDILDLSVSRLQERDRDRFAMLADFSPDPATWDVLMAAAVWRCAPEDAEDTVSLLIQRGIVERRGDAYWMHALLRDYAEALLDERFD